jgi:hypothetical protein
VRQQAVERDGADEQEQQRHTIAAARDGTGAGGGAASVDGRHRAAAGERGLERWQAVAAVRAIGIGGLAHGGEASGPAGLADHSVHHRRDQRRARAGADRQQPAAEVGHEGEARRLDAGDDAVGDLLGWIGFEGAADGAGLVRLVLVLPRQLRGVCTSGG